MKILISLGKAFYHSFDQLGRWLRDGGHDVVEQVGFDYAPPKQLIKDLVFDVDIYVVGVDEVDAEIMDAAPQLKLIVKHGAGYNNIDLEHAKKRGIAVTYARGANAQSVAELAIALMFAISRRVVPGANKVQSGGWSLFMGDELHGKTLGLIGYGNIGQRVARIAKSLDMRILVCDPFLNEATLLADGVAPMSVDEVFRGADYLSLHAPATLENADIVNASTLALMKPTAYLINTARGELLDEEALADALRRGQLRAAALDVFKQEPPQGALLELDNVLLTSHIGGCTVDSAKKLSMASFNSIKCFTSGQPLEDRLV